MSYRAIDLFAGAGGLTVGLRRAGFDVTSAVESDAHAVGIYRVNHAAVRAFEEDVRDLRGDSDLFPRGRKAIALLAGCPPCQGFTSLTTKYRRRDSRNLLVMEMARLAAELRPAAIMMENVPKLANDNIYTTLRAQLKKLGYLMSDSVLQVANYGVPQFRRRLVLLGGLGFDIELPMPTHSASGKGGLQRWRTVRDAIGHLDPDAPTLAEAKAGAGVHAANWHVVRTLSAANRKRIRAARPGQTWPSIPESLRPRCHKGNYRGFTNVYGRMEWDRPSPTITGGCTTFSKGRFGHPEVDRTISVREAALLQTFPEDYVLATPYMEHACNVIGNALPCDFAEVVAKQCYNALQENGLSKEAYR